MKNSIFEDLFVLELANNHWGDIERGKKIINDFKILLNKRYSNWEKLNTISYMIKDIDIIIDKTDLCTMF